MSGNQYSGQRSPEDKVKYSVIERLGTIGRKDSGWTKEVNIISWNNGPAKVDIREWDPQHVRMSKGVTLLEEEARLLTTHLIERYGLMGAGVANRYAEACHDADELSSLHTQTDTAGGNFEEAAEDIPFDETRTAADTLS